MKSFKPILFSNESVPIIELPNKPFLASLKLDGIRCIFMQGYMKSRSLKQIQNKQLQEKFNELRQYSHFENLILDGELYAHGRTFQEITRAVMTQDFYEEKTRNKLMKELQFNNDEDYNTYVTSLIDGIQFHCFDTLDPNNLNEPFASRLDSIPTTLPHIIKVKQLFVTEKFEIQQLFDTALKKGYEGLMLRCPRSTYKFGRVTNKSEDGYKIKNYKTFDAQITGFIQATVVCEGSERTKNELGYSETSKKKGDRVLIPRLAAFLVKYNGVEQKVVYAATDEEKEVAWRNRFDLHGKWIEFKGMLEGSKDRVRHPVFVRWRDDKNEK